MGYIPSLFDEGYKHPGFDNDPERQQSEQDKPDDGRLVITVILTGIVACVVVSMFFALSSFDIPEAERVPIFTMGGTVLIWGRSSQVLEQEHLIKEDRGYYAGELPSDICIVDGVPQVLSAMGHTYHRSQNTLVYLSTSGDVVVLYDNKPSHYYSGGSCPASGAER